MKRTLWPIIAAMALLGSSPDGAAQTAFPEVPLVNNSAPRFVVLALDETGEQNLFMLLDGNREAEYKRAYVWIPNHPRYGRPVAVERGQNEYFPPLTVPVTENPRVETTWQVRAWVDEAHARDGGRTATRHDYLTGQTVTYTIDAREARQRFDFRVRYRHAGQYARSLAAATDPLDMIIEGELPTGTEWNKRPDPTTPWRNLYLRFNVDEERLEDDRNNGRLVFQTRVVHHQHHGTRVQFTTLPESARIKLDVFPYLQQPLFSEALPAARLLAGGVPVKVPFGWYQFTAEFQCEGLDVTTFNRQVFPFSRR